MVYIYGGLSVVLYVGQIKFYRLDGMTLNRCVLICEAVYLS